MKAPGKLGYILAGGLLFSGIIAICVGVTTIPWTARPMFHHRNIEERRGIADFWRINWIRRDAYNRVLYFDHDLSLMVIALPPEDILSDMVLPACSSGKATFYLGSKEEFTINAQKNSLLAFCKGRLASRCDIDSGSIRRFLEYLDKWCAADSGDKSCDFQKALTAAGISCDLACER